MRGGKRELRADTLKPVPQGVFIQFAWFRRIVAHSEQVIDGVLILLPTQAIMCHRRTRCHPHRLALFEPRVEFSDEGRDFVLLRLRLVFRRHLAAVDLFDHLRPKMAVFAHSEIARELIEAKIPLLFVRAVAAGTMRLEKGLKRFLGRNHGGHGEGYKKEETRSDYGHRHCGMDHFFRRKGQESRRWTTRMREDGVVGFPKLELLVTLRWRHNLSRCGLIFSSLGLPWLAPPAR